MSAELQAARGDLRAAQNRVEAARLDHARACALTEAALRSVGAAAVHVREIETTIERLEAADAEARAD